jgi:hypothetical protein
MSKVICVTHDWPDGICRKCGATNESKHRFAQGTRARAELFSRINTGGTVFGSGKKDS